MLGGIKLFSAVSGRGFLGWTDGVHVLGQWHLADDAREVDVYGRLSSVSHVGVWSVLFWTSG